MDGKKYKQTRSDPASMQPKALVLAETSSHEESVLSVQTQCFDGKGRPLRYPASTPKPAAAMDYYDDQEHDRHGASSNRGTVPTRIGQSRDWSRPSSFNGCTAYHPQAALPAVNMGIRNTSLHDGLTLRPSITLSYRLPENVSCKRCASTWCSSAEQDSSHEAAYHQNFSVEHLQASGEPIIPPVHHADNPGMGSPEGSNYNVPESYRPELGERHRRDTRGPHGYSLDVE